MLWGGGNALAQYANVPADQVFRTDQERYGHIEYFGFYASAMGHWNFTEELAPFTNLTWIHVGSADDEPAAIEAMLERLREARAAGVRATLSIEPLLFLNLAGDPRPDEDIEDFLVELRAHIEEEGLLDTVAMIYPKDEPFREFIRYRDPDFIEQYVTGEVYEDIHEDLVHVNELVKLVFPETPIGVILSGYDLHHRFFSIPENYDWVGFDCYENLFKSCDDRSFVEHYRRLLNYMQPHQRLIAVPEVWAQHEDRNNADWAEVLLRRFRQHYEIALNEPRFIAFVPFIWSFDADNETPGVGLNRIPEWYDDGISDQGSHFVELVEQIGRQIKTREPTFPNMAWEETEATRWRPGSAQRGEIMSITRRGLISAWAVDEALPHKNLRVRILVRDQNGRLVHKSRPERTFIDDPDLGYRVGRALVGLHGYRYQLPGEMLARMGGHQLSVELVTYADGVGGGVGYSYLSSFVPDYRLQIVTR